MLLDNFFSITNREFTDGAIKATLSIHEDHPIVKGHFPGMPVVPGVVMLEMVIEIVELQLGYNLYLREAKNLKFVSVLNPEQNKVVQVSVTYTKTGDQVTVNAAIFEGDVVFFKLVNATLQRPTDT